MLISHPKRFIYLKTRKTGGTSAEIFLEKYCKPPELAEEENHYGPALISEHGVVGFRGVTTDGQTWYSHMPAERVRDLVDPEVWADYLKFCIVRNPFDRMVSYFWMMVPPNLRAPASADMAAARTIFSQWALSAQQLPSDRHIYLIDGKPCVDRMLRYEKFDEELASVCAHLGLDADLARLGRYKSEFRARKESYRDYYSPEARARVEREFAADLEMLGYSF